MSNNIIIPWEERPAGCTDVMWRYSANPVIGRYHIPSSNSIFNSAVVPFGEGFAGVFRCDNRAVQMNIFAGFSQDGIHWEISHEPIRFQAGNRQTVLPSASAIRSTSANSSNARTPSCPSTATASSSRRRLADDMPC